ncbi:MAG: glutamate mutase L [Angustibacter sp.]
MALVLCVDFGSTFTKAALVDVDAGAVVATETHRTTLATDVLDGYHAIQESLRRSGFAEADEVRVGPVGHPPGVPGAGDRRQGACPVGRRSRTWCGQRPRMSTPRSPRRGRTPYRFGPQQVPGCRRGP